MRRGKIIARNYLLHLRKRVRQIWSDALYHWEHAPYCGEDFVAIVHAIDNALTEAVEHQSREVRRGQRNYEPLFSIPPARRKPSAEPKPVTVVERRAIAAKRKVREWQRKQKLAATKIKQYRKKVSYYTKKGVIQ